MKDKILFLILGILIGAVITAGCFLFINKNNNKNFQRRNFDKEMIENFENGEKPKGGKKGNKDQNIVSSNSNIINTEEVKEENKLESEG